MSSTTAQEARPKRRSAADRKAKAQARLQGGNSPAIRPGMQGQYRPLKDDDLTRIHEAALTILEHTGIGDPLPELLDIVLPLGAQLNDYGRPCFPRSMIETSSLELLGNTRWMPEVHGPERTTYTATVIGFISPTREAPSRLWTATICITARLPSSICTTLPGWLTD